MHVHSFQDIFFLGGGGEEEDKNKNLDKVTLFCWNIFKVIF